MGAIDGARQDRGRGRECSWTRSLGDMFFAGARGEGGEPLV